MTCYCYCRVSSSLQTLENQHFEIEKYTSAHNIKIDEWVEETISSRKPLNERKLGKLLKKLKAQDILRPNFREWDAICWKLWGFCSNALKKIVKSGL